MHPSATIEIYMFSGRSWIMTHPQPPYDCCISRVSAASDHWQFEWSEVSLILGCCKPLIPAMASLESSADASFGVSNVLQRIVSRDCLLVCEPMSRALFRLLYVASHDKKNWLRYSNNKPPIFDGSYQPFVVIGGMVYYCYTNIMTFAELSWFGRKVRISWDNFMKTSR